MQEREISDQEFEDGLRAVLGDRFQDLTAAPVRRKKQPDRTWEWICWAGVYGSLGILFFWLR